MTKIYFKHQKNRKKEIDFFNFLKKHLGEIEHVNENFKIDSSLHNNFVNIKKVLKELEKEEKLSALKRQRLILELQKLPEKVFVAKNMTEVSVDFVIIHQEKTFYLEFHENQHSQLSVSRITPIFCSNNLRNEVPRFAQRFIKDIWRFENLPNYKIVWWDWFEKNSSKVPLKEILESNSFEFYNPGKFNFSSLYLR